MQPVRKMNRFIVEFELGAAKDSMIEQAINFTNSRCHFKQVFFLVNFLFGAFWCLTVLKSYFFPPVHNVVFMLLCGLLFPCKVYFTELCSQFIG